MTKGSEGIEKAKKLQGSGIWVHVKYNYFTNKGRHFLDTFPLCFGLFSRKVSYILGDLC